MKYPQTRLRRLRAHPALRQLVSECKVSPQHLIWPAFVIEGESKRLEIASMPGVFHFSVDELVKEAKLCSEEGIPALLLFGVPNQKDDRATQATHQDALVSRAIRAVKEACPKLLVMTDVCLCAYTTHGHCGIVDKQGTILNDASLEVLAAMALTHAKAGADIIAPSDMMDGRVGFIRKTLDQNNFENTAIMSYAAKFSSSFYGPFRDAAHSAPQFGDRKTYQMNPANRREAVREVLLDIEEGADIVMVKPALTALDVIHEVKGKVDVPVAAYHVSGEYSMIQAAAQKGWLSLHDAMAESLLAIRRAGADMIITYYAREYARRWRD